MPLSDFTPSLSDVGSRLRRRTMDDYGQQTGTFKDPDPDDSRVKTTPTAAEVTPLIADAVRDVASAVGSDLPDGPADEPELFREQAQRLAALRAALLIELEFFGQEVASTHGSTYPQMEKLWNDSMKRFIEQVNEAGGGTGTGGESVGSDSAPSASYGFPLATDWDNRRF